MRKRTHEAFPATKNDLHQEREKLEHMKRIFRLNNYEKAGQSLSSLELRVHVVMYIRNTFVTR